MGLKRRTHQLSGKSEESDRQGSCPSPKAHHLLICTLERENWLQKSTTEMRGDIRPGKSVCGIRPLVKEVHSRDDLTMIAQESGPEFS
jgi:hypothetical protein